MDDLDRILAGPHRSEHHKARDQYRHPREVFEFFELAADQTVVDVWPGSSGWTTEILAPFLREHGTYIAAGYDPATETSFDAAPSQQAFEDKLKAEPHLYDRVVTGAVSPSVFDIGEDNSVDLILVLRLHHIFMGNGFIDAFNSACLRALRTGGILGVVEHREDPTQPRDPAYARGYVHQDEVIDVTSAAGLRLDAISEINGNPRDSKDHPKAVWSLPPWMWDVPDEDKPRYQAIGESDRMTLRFIKP